MTTYKLVIVESPAKAQDHRQIPGAGATRWRPRNGHVRDLPKSQIGVDVEQRFRAAAISPSAAGARSLEKIRKEASGASKVILATDPDREGEAISWHLANMLKIDAERPTAAWSSTRSPTQAVKTAMK